MSSTDPTWGGWAPRWYLWDGGFFAIGRTSGVVPPHAHHAVQIVISLDGFVRLRGADEVWRDYRGAIVQPDVEHSFDGADSLLLMLFVDPESKEGRWIRDSLREPVTAVPNARLERCVPELLRFHESPLDALDTTELIELVVGSLCAGAPPSRALDVRITRALELIREAESVRISVDEVAAAVFLSPSRFAHLFREHVGLPFRRYLLWRKLSRAMLAIGRGATLSLAAQEGGFSDSAHLTRTFYQMFGTAPSVMMRGEFYEVPAPFELPARSS